MLILENRILVHMFKNYALEVHIFVHLCSDCFVHLLLKAKVHEVQ